MTKQRVCSGTEARAGLTLRLERGLLPAQTGTYQASLSALDLVTNKKPAPYTFASQCNQVLSQGSRQCSDKDLRPNYRYSPYLRAPYTPPKEETAEVDDPKQSTDPSPFKALLQAPGLISEQATDWATTLAGGMGGGMLRFLDLGNNREAPI